MRFSAQTGARLLLVLLECSSFVLQRRRRPRPASSDGWGSRETQQTGATRYVYVINLTSLAGDCGFEPDDARDLMAFGSVNTAIRFAS
jgi:hypothetical protein